MQAAKVWDCKCWDKCLVLAGDAHCQRLGLGEEGVCKAFRRLQWSTQWLSKVHDYDMRTAYRSLTQNNEDSLQTLIVYR